MLNFPFFLALLISPSRVYSRLSTQHRCASRPTKPSGFWPTLPQPSSAATIASPLLPTSGRRRTVTGTSPLATLLLATALPQTAKLRRCQALAATSRLVCACSATRGALGASRALRQAPRARRALRTLCTRGRCARSGWRRGAAMRGRLGFTAPLSPPASPRSARTAALSSEAQNGASPRCRRPRRRSRQ